MRSRRLSVLFPLLAPLTVSAAWIPGPPLPETRTVLAAARDSADRIYVIGGNINGGLCGMQPPSKTVFILVKGPGASWVSIAPLNLGRHALAAAMDPEGGVYAIGGTADTNWATDQMEKLDPRTGVWEFVAHMPAPRMNHRAVTARDGTIWVLGGIDNAVTSLPIYDTVFIYDPSTDRWSEGPPMLSGRKEFGAAVDRQGRIYVVGGEVDENGVPDSMEIYDPATGRWEYGPPRPSHGCWRGCLVGGSAIDRCGRIYLIGGWSGGGGHQMDEVDRFDPRTGLWEQLDCIPVATAGLAAVATSTGQIYIMGGEHGICATTDVYVMDTGCVGPPSPPTGVSAVDAGTGGAVNVAWQLNPAGENVSAYNVYYGQAPRSYDSHVTVGANVTSCQLSGLDDYVTYYIAVTAVNAGGESDYSTEVTAVPTLPASRYAKALAEIAIAVEHLMKAKDLGADYSECIQRIVDDAERDTFHFIWYQQAKYGAQQKSIISAWAAYNEGLEEKVAGRFSEAVKKFRLGWVHAEQAK